jgi:hypothetical protein
VEVAVPDLELVAAAPVATSLFANPASVKSLIGFH